MGNVIPFKRPGECCGTCRYYVPPRPPFPMLLDGPPSAYCNHPDRVGCCYLTEDLIENLNLYRSPHKWCTRYEPRYPGECCGTCRHYILPRPPYPTLLDGPPSAYCNHPSRVGCYYLNEELIEKLKLYRSPQQWCTRHERREWSALDTGLEKSDGDLEFLPE